ncbi:MAG: PSD1 and planctomycete cytochrome C domain-containing protein [Armatimonadetes bacterium]|nr:PSD1 and planctomycete cytochrome C domain-containing protein [Armatimonadota bacterium]
MKIGFRQLLAFSPLLWVVTAFTTANGQKNIAPEKRKVAQEAIAILKQSCLSCHSGDKPMGNLKLLTRADLIKGGLSGSAINLAKPNESLLLKAVRFQGRQMPPSGKLSIKQIEVLAKWIEQGALWVADKAGKSIPAPNTPPKVTPETMKFWSFQPVKRPTPPTVKGKSWVKSPIDAFVLQGLESANLTPNPSASKVALLRRATYDLTGLPPTPEETRAFLTDTSTTAYQKVLDRLLASPQYGVKWGRHWLDLVRYAETNSYERDGHKPNAWRYRDYVIRSFNADKPYDEFVREQLAGDEMPQRTPEKIIATGFYRLGLWDDEPADPKQALFDDLDDIVSTTGQVFLGLTVNCARCHDHKIDPIPQKDYYRMLSFLAGVRRHSYGEGSMRPIAPEAEVKLAHDAIKAHEARMRENMEAIQSITKPAYADLSPVEKEEWRNEDTRTQIVQKRVGKILTQESFDRYKTLREARKKMEQFQPPALDTALCVSEEGRPRTIHILMRGNPHAEGDEVQPGFPSVLNFPEPTLPSAPYPDTSGRRTVLANWIASPKNPMTARVVVNRVWQYHFGRGIVRTPSNFGFQGNRPTHPALLDWLADEFVQDGWKFKTLHRKIMLSATYQMSVRNSAKAYAKDPENDLFWRFDMRRLEAEEVRDSILAANGSLNLQLEGPSIYVKIPDVVLAGQSVPGAGWGNSPNDQQRRRSTYIYQKRSLATPIIASFDGPETDLSCPLRFSTTQPTQALGMLNSDFINEEAQVFASFVSKSVGSNPTKQVRLALARVMQREPNSKEVERGLRLLQTLQTKHHRTPEESLKYFCVVALNLNEFLYLE